MLFSTLTLSLIIIQTLTIDCSTLPARTVQFDFYSDIDDWVNGNLYPNGAFAVIIDINPIRDPTTNGYWIWESPMPYDKAQNLTIYVSKSFYIPGTPTWAQMIIQADNFCSVKLNNVATTCGTSNYLEIKTCDLTSKIVAGNNMINITVVNLRGGFSNYGGVTYKLSVKSTVKAIEELS